MRVGEAIRLLRVYHDLKQHQFAHLLDMSTSYVSEVEKGQKTPSLQVLDRMARTFDITMSSLLYFAEIVELPSGTPLPPYPTQKTLDIVEMSRLRHSISR